MRSLFLKPVVVAVTMIAVQITACRHRSKDDGSLAGLQGDDQVPTFYLHQNLTGGQDQCINNLVNATTDAIADGLLMNGAITGLGTNTPVGPKLTTDSLYYQMLRIYSVFDWRFADALRNRSLSCLPNQVGFGVANLARTYTDSLSRPYQEQVEKLHAALRAMSRDSTDFAVVEADGFYQPERWPKLAAGNEAFRKAMMTGATATLAKIRRDSARTDDAKAKLKAMAAGFSPLIISYNSIFPQPMNQGRTYIEAYLPPLYELDISNIEQPLTWNLKVGLKKRELPRMVDISIAKLTHIGYLAGTPKEAEPVIKLQIYKDYSDPDKLITRAMFGKVDERGLEPGYLPLEYRDFRTALVLSFFPNLEIKPGDSAILRRAKQEFNELVNVMRVDARIHQLTVELQRTPNQDPVKDGVEAILFKPHFSFQDSDISFRVYLDASSAHGRSALEATGFVCQAAAGEVPAECYRDFGAFEEFNQYFANEETGLASMSENSGWAGRFRRALNTLIRYNTRFLINWNMDAIEHAIDAQFVEIFSMIADRQTELRDKINERLERELFSTRR